MHILARDKLANIPVEYMGRDISEIFAATRVSQEWSNVDDHNKVLQTQVHFTVWSNPLNQCLCDLCDNLELLRRALVAVGVKGIPPNKYDILDSTTCDVWHSQYDTSYKFSMYKCITRNCAHCGKNKLGDIVKSLNTEVIRMNKALTWHRWQLIQGRSVPQKCPIRGTLQSGVNEFLDIVEQISEHLFRANWNFSIFQYIKKNLKVGYVLQVLDFTMNFNNRYQDEVQSAYWGRSKTTIHMTINFYRCLQEGCSEVCMLAHVHIMDDLKHDSFLVRAAQNLTFRYLAEIGIPLDLIIQFCNNCSSQYNSRRPFAEMACSSLDIIRVYFGEKHGKSHADALFGCLKAWMSYKVKARHFMVTDAYDFYKYCREYYEIPVIEDACQHYLVVFQFIQPSDVKQHQDCDLDNAVQHTHDYYSIRNMCQPLQLKFRYVPCLCDPCINDDRTKCMNAEYTDDWKTVDLIPKKGSNKEKYDKRKRPDADTHPIIPSADIVVEEVKDRESSDDELPEISFDAHPFKKWEDLKKKTSSESEHVTDSVTDNAVTDHVTDHTKSTCEQDTSNKHCTWINSEEQIGGEQFPIAERSLPECDSRDIEVISLCEEVSKEFSMAAENTLPVPTDNIIVDHP